ncbi:MAG: 4-hydroxy-tetrahydrodipicolinate reductase [Peptococcaceae bacterium]
MQKIKVGVMGACGKMGQEICKSVIDDNELELMVAFDVINQGMDMGILIGRPDTGVKIETNYHNLLAQKPDVIIDFSNAQAVLNNVPQVIENGIDVVIGTTGLTNNEIEDLRLLAKENNTGIFIAPNFAIGAVLMMQFAKEAARYFPHVEIIEQHHDQKLDSPSGTAFKTLEEISQNRAKVQQGNPQEYEKISGARGGDYEGIRVHSVRLPGLIAHQEVIFGGEGQILTIRHDSLSRASFMPGILLAVKKIHKTKGFIYGLDSIL